MGIRTNLLAWQWSTYPANHTRRVTLAVHLLAVPLFAIGFASALAELARGRWGAVALALGAAALGFALQGIVHKREPVAPVPFAGPLDVISRIFVEQYFTFWRFLFSGGWGRAWRAA